MKGCKKNWGNFPPKKVDSNTVRFLFQVALELFWKLRFLDFFGPDFFLKLAKNSLKLETPLALLVRYSAGGPFCCYFFGWEDYVPELWEIGLDPAVQGVPVKKKRSVHK